MLLAAEDLFRLGTDIEITLLYKEVEYSVQAYQCSPPTFWTDIVYLYDDSNPKYIDRVPASLLTDGMEMLVNIEHKMYKVKSLEDELYGVFLADEC